MAVPNLANIRSIVSKTEGANLTTPFVARNIIYNNCGVARKMTSIWLHNYSNTGANVNVAYYKGTDATTYRLATNIFMPTGNVLNLSNKLNAIVLNEGDSLIANVDANNRVHMLMTYDELSDLEYAQYKANLASCIPYTLEVLMVAGGGGGGAIFGGGGAPGGGGGGVLYGNVFITAGFTANIQIGAGGAGENATFNGGNGISGGSRAGPGARGGNTIITIGGNTISAAGGGCGDGTLNQRPGGSSAGGGTATQANINTTVGGFSWSLQGFGFNGSTGGGGAGGTSPGQVGGVGRQFLQFPGFGANTSYFAGGGGGGTQGSPYVGGLGGGGIGYGPALSAVPSAAGGNAELIDEAMSGYPNTGGGGGAPGGPGWDSVDGGAGGSGVVLFRYLISERDGATGGSVSNVGGTHRIHAFLGSGTFNT
jgi:hypothetical protein